MSTGAVTHWQSDVVTVPGAVPALRVRRVKQLLSDGTFRVARRATVRKAGRMVSA